MLAASALDLFNSRHALLLLSGHELIIWLIGFIAAFLTAIVGVRFFIKYIQKNNFIPFGWYRIALALVVFTWLMLK